MNTFTHKPIKSVLTSPRVVIPVDQGRDKQEVQVFGEIGTQWVLVIVI